MTTRNQLPADSPSAATALANTSVENEQLTITMTPTCARSRGIPTHRRPLTCRRPGESIGRTCILFGSATEIVMRS
jgi:hypothetical protein